MSYNKKKKKNVECLATLIMLDFVLFLGLSPVANNDSIPYLSKSKHYKNELIKGAQEAVHSNSLGIIYDGLRLLHCELWSVTASNKPYQECGRLKVSLLPLFFLSFLYQEVVISH